MPAMNQSCRCKRFACAWILSAPWSARPSILRCIGFLLVSPAWGAGLGGGANSGASAGSGSTFPMASVLAKLASARSYTQLISGTGSMPRLSQNQVMVGTGTVTQGDPKPATFENKSALMSLMVTTTTMSINGASRSAGTTTVEWYTDTAHVPIGQKMVGRGIYRVAQGNPMIPATVRIGDTGIIGQYADYTDSSKTTQQFVSTYAYAIVDDTPATAHTAVYQFTLTQSAFPGGKLFLTSTTSWRMDTSGNVRYLYEKATSTPRPGIEFHFTYTCNSGC